MKINSQAFIFTLDAALAMIALLALASAAVLLTIPTSNPNAFPALQQKVLDQSITGLYTYADSDSFLSANDSTATCTSYYQYNAYGSSMAEKIIPVKHCEGLR